MNTSCNGSNHRILDCIDNDDTCYHFQPFSALLMKDFEDEHVLTLIGVLMEESFSPLVVLPFMKHGDLLTFVRNPENT